jgi:hypothetical protein
MVTCSMGAGGVIAYVNKNTSPVICGRVIVPRGREILDLMQTLGLYATLFVGKPRGLRVWWEYICTYDIYIYIYICVCMYVYIYICVYIYVYVDIWTN